MGSPLTIAMTGGIGSGKTTVANLFSSKGVPVIDSDLIAREIVEPGKPAWQSIVDEFGEETLNADQTLDRKKLAQVVFNDPAKKRLLESILHPRIYAEIDSRTKQQDFPYCIIVIPLLLETDSARRFDRILVVDVPEEVQMQRTLARDNCTKDLVERIMAAQVSRTVRLAAADDVVSNDVTIEQLQGLVDELHDRYLGLAG